jgi:cation-transporting ATPase 13A1
MVLKGIALPQRISVVGVEELNELEANCENIYSAEVCSSAVLAAMGCCHSLLVNKSEIVGDPMELATFIESGFMIDDVDGMHSEKLEAHYKIRKRYAFSSALKRMSVLAESAGGNYTVFSKGAPEVLMDKLSVVPELYAETYQFHMTRGKRVIAIAYKPLPVGSVSSSREMKRADMERELRFLGFLVFDCNLKPDSKSVIKELLASDHRVVMITGDSPYTAADVSRRLGMTKNENLLLSVVVKDSANWAVVWRPGQIIMKSLNSLLMIAEYPS